MADEQDTGEQDTGEIKAYVVGEPASVQKADYLQASRGSRAQTIDQILENQYIAGRVLCPPYDIDALCTLPEESSILPQCITAYVTNVAGFGWDLAYIGEEGKEQDDVAQQEKQTLRRFFTTVNDRESFVSIHKRVRQDLETTGNAYIEVIRNMKAEVVQMEHLPTILMRLGKIDPVSVVVKVVMQVGPDSITRFVRRAFRRYVQVQSMGRKVWFKEFGDPRPISAKTGRVLSLPTIEEQDNAANENNEVNAAGIPYDEEDQGQITIGDLATEVLYFKLYSPKHIYGIPRYIGALLPIKGMRSAETVNWSYFQRNAIPPLLIMVSGGALTKTSFDQIMGYFRSQSNATLDNYHQALVLEATPKGTGLEDRGTVNIATKSLQDVRLSDAQFQQYEKNSTTKIRSAFRLPEIYVGLTEGMNYATANAARLTAEEQIFSVERQGFDEVINLQLLRAMGIQYWAYYTKGPEIADLPTYTAAVNTFNSVGAMTPNQAIMLANELLGTTLKPIEQPWGDYAFPIVMELLMQQRLAGVEEIETQAPAGLPVPGAPGQSSLNAPIMSALRLQKPIINALGLNPKQTLGPSPFSKLGQLLGNHAANLSQNANVEVKAFADGLMVLAQKCAELGAATNGNGADVEAEA